MFPSDRFYDAVVAAADLVSSEGGLVTFLFTEVRPPEQVLDDDHDGRPNDVLLLAELDNNEEQSLLDWQQAQIDNLGEARKLLYERGLDDGQINYLFADEGETESAAQAIADEAAAGAFDLVVLSRGYFIDEVSDLDSPPEEVAGAVEALDGEVKLMVV